jgi:hypothetical protein
MCADCPKQVTTQTDPAGSSGSAPLNVADRKQLFIDYRFIESCEGVRLTMNPPRRHGPVLRGDKPWERVGAGAYLTVMEVEDKFRMYYQAWEGMKKSHTCVALSHDGIHWEKPNLGLVEHNGSKENNIVRVHGTPFVDPNASPDERFRAVEVAYQENPVEECGLFIACSPDGIHWSGERKRVLTLAPDTQNQVFFDTRIGKYVAYLRSWNPLRKVVRCEIEDLLTPWPFTPLEQPRKLWGDDRPAVPSREFPTAISYDERDPPETDIYTPSVFQYPWAEDAYFAFPSIYRHFPAPPEGKYENDGLLDVQLALSRDGVRFERPFRMPYVPLGGAGERDGAQIYMGVGALRIGDEIYQYYGGYGFTHGEFVEMESRRDAGAACLAVQRLDGFVSADAAYEGGTFTTPLMVFSGKRLLLNVEASALGEVRVEVLGEHGLPIPGFSAVDCEPVRGNHIAGVIRFGERQDLSTLTGKPVRLRFRMRAAKLYSFQFPG